MLPIILAYAISIHRLQGTTCDLVILNVGSIEFALGILYVGSTRTKKYLHLAFHPFPNYNCFQQIKRHKLFQNQHNEMERLMQLEKDTIDNYASNTLN